MSNKYYQVTALVQVYKKGANSIQREDIEESLYASDTCITNYFPIDEKVYRAMVERHEVVPNRELEELQKELKQVQKDKRTVEKMHKEALEGQAKQERKCKELQDHLADMLRLFSGVRTAIQLKQARNKLMELL